MTYFEYIFSRLFCPTKSVYKKNNINYPIKVERAPEPSDINWENISVPSSEK